MSIQVLTTVLDKESVEGFASIILRLASRSGSPMSQEQTLLSYQWLEHMAMYANQAISNPIFAKNFLQVRLSILFKDLFDYLNYFIKI